MRPVGNCPEHSWTTGLGVQDCLANFVHDHVGGPIVVVGHSDIVTALVTLLTARLTGSAQREHYAT